MSLLEVNFLMHVVETVLLVIVLVIVFRFAVTRHKLMHQFMEIMDEMDLLRKDLESRKQEFDLKEGMDA